MAVPCTLDFRRDLRNLNCVQRRGQLDFGVQLNLDANLRLAIWDTRYQRERKVSVPRRLVLFVGPIRQICQSG